MLFQGDTPEGDRVGVELLFNSVEFGCQSSCQQTPRGLETRCGREGHTRPRGPSESPDGVYPNIRRTRKTQRLCSVSSTLSHANLTNKVRGKYNCKEVFLPASSFLRLPSCVVSSCVFLLRLSACVFIIESLWYGKWVSNTQFNCQKTFLFQTIQPVICNNSVKCKYSFNVEKQFYLK